MEEEQNHTPITPLDRMKTVDAALDEYELSIGLPVFVENMENKEVHEYLQMSRQQMEKLSLQDCAQGAIILSGYAFYLQRCYNREISRINWADSI